MVGGQLQQITLLPKRPTSHSPPSGRTRRRVAMPDRLPTGSNIVASAPVVLQDKQRPSVHEAASARDSASDVFGIRKLQGSLIGKVWPGERIVLGLKVSRWLRQEIRENADRVVLKGCGEQTSVCPFGTAECRDEGAEAGLGKGMDQERVEEAVRRDLTLYQNCAAAVELHSLASCQHLQAILAAVMAAGTRRSPSVVHLDLKQCRITEAVSEQAAQILSLHTDLSTFNISDAKFDPREPALRCLTDGLRKCHALTHLDLSKNNLGSEPLFGELMASLPQHSSLSYLHLGENNVCDGASVARALSSAGACKHLSLNGNRIGPEGARWVAGALRHCSSLEHLDLSGNAVGCTGAAALAESITGGGRRTLKVLKVSGNDLEAEGLTALAEAVGRCQELRQLDLSTNRMGAEGAEVLVEGLREGGGRMERLELRECGVAEDGAVLLCALLSACPALQHLDLAGNTLRPEPFSNQLDPGPPLLAAARGTLRRLYELDWYSSPAKVGGAGRLRERAKYTGLTRLELGSCGLRAESVGQMGVVLLRCNALRRLSLRGNRLEPAGARALADALRECGALRSLDLTGCKVGGAGMESVAEALAGRTALESLWLARNEATDRGVEALSARLGSWGSSLQELTLRENKVGARGAIALARGLHECAALRLLDLAHNELGKVGAEELAKGIGDCTSLTHLVLRWNEIGAEGAERLAEGVRGRCERLKHLDLRSNELGKEGAERLVALLQQERGLTCLDLRCNNKSWLNRLVHT